MAMEKPFPTTMKRGFGEIKQGWRDQRKCVQQARQQTEQHQDAARERHGKGSNQLVFID